MKTGNPKGGRPRKHKYAGEKHLSARIPDNMHKALRRRAFKSNMPMSYHICIALEKYLDVARGEK
jgi:hypothetical protein